MTIGCNYISATQNSPRGGLVTWIPWLRVRDSNPRLPGYEPGFLPLDEPAMLKNEGGVERKQKVNPPSDNFGWGTRVRTWTVRVKVACATTTQCPNKQDTLNYFALPVRRLAKARKTGFEPAIQDVPILFAVCVLNFGDLRRIRTYVSWLRTRCPSPLDE